MFWLLGGSFFSIAEIQEFLIPGHRDRYIERKQVRASLHTFSSLLFLLVLRAGAN
jgi:hypothetical protein